MLVLVLADPSTRPAEIGCGTDGGIVLAVHCWDLCPLLVAAAAPTSWKLPGEHEFHCPWEVSTTAGRKAWP